MPKPSQRWKHREKRLGREKAVGVCHYEKETIFIDPRQTPAEFLDTLVHEHLHKEFQDLTEAEVLKASRAISTALWDYGYRLVPACKTIPTDEPKKEKARKTRK